MRRFLMLLAVAITAAGGAQAHHGWSKYDAAKKFTITAKVEQLSWSNPHGQIVLKHDNADWTVILAPITRMSNRGLTEEMLKVGATVAAEGYPSTETPNEMRAERITVDGKVVELR